MLNCLYIDNDVVFAMIGNWRRNCRVIQISVQMFRIQNNEAEVEINPGPEAVQNDHA